MFRSLQLILSIAVTHVVSRLRQTIVGVAGVATGVGFSIMMAGLMQGSQADFISQLVDSLPHVSVSDERRAPPMQPAALIFDAAQIANVSTPTLRPGLKNPYAIIASLESWLPGAVAPSVQARAVIRFAGRDTATNLVGIDPRREPRVSKLATQIRGGSLSDLYRSSNAIILGDGLARKLGVRVGNSITLASASGQIMSARVIGFYHSGVKQADDTQSFTLLKTAQILAGQTALVNELRVRLDDVMAARTNATRIEAETGYKSVSWQEANEDLLSAFMIRDIIMYTVVGAILLVASFGTFNIISTITHEKTRDIAIMKSLGFPEALVRRIFVVEALMIGLMGMSAGFVLGYALSLGMETIRFPVSFGDKNTLPMAYSALHYAIAGGVALASSLIAGYFPARKAASLHPVDIIRGAS